jgi:putative alpha-1,2-mannosidase
MVSNDNQICRRAFIKNAIAASAAMVGVGILRLTGRRVLGDPVVDFLGGAAVPGLAGQVRPMIGTGWKGHTFPGAIVPFGLMQLSPDAAGPPEVNGLDWKSPFSAYEWDHCSGYHYPDTTILGFSHTHLSGTGAPELGDILLMPIVEGRNWGWNPGAPGNQHEAQIVALGSNSGWVSRDGHTGYASRFSHQQETARAGYYSVYLQTPQVKADLTATTRCGMHRYTYPALPADTRRGLILDLVHGLNNAPYAAELTIESPTRISGKRYSRGWAKNRQAYFVMEFSAPIKSYDVMAGNHVTGGLSPGAKRFSSAEIKAIFHWDSDAVNHKHPLLIRVGISGTGVEGAAKNLAAEIPHWDFDSLEQQTQRVWNKALGVLDADLPTMESAQTFYTSAYHAMIGPTTFNDADGAFRGEDGKNHPNPGFTNYTAISIWDFYRSQFPFMMLTQPQRTNDLVNTMLTDYRQLGQRSLPMWPLWGNETWGMIGFHAVAMILGAYTRGFRGYDVEAAYAAMRETALVRGNRGGPVSCVQDSDYDFWCVGAMAELLGKQDDAKMFYKYSQNYKNFFDPKTGFMRGKTAAGQWREPFQPNNVYRSDYAECDAWQATFNVMHDVQGLIDLFGGDAPFIAKLDALFTAPSHIPQYDPDITGMIGQDAQGNEPSNHIPYLYPFAGAAWKTQYWIRKVLALYNNTPRGIPGNDDVGQISSCFTLGALGFYPVNAATGVYVIGSPLINRAKINNPATGTTFTIIAENNSAENCYIQSAKLNGKELMRSWFTHGDIVAGGELYFRMGRKPNKDWASSKADRPPSGLVL